MYNAKELAVITVSPETVTELPSNQLKSLLDELRPYQHKHRVVGDVVAHIVAVLRARREARIRKQCFRLELRAKLR